MTAKTNLLVARRRGWRFLLERWLLLRWLLLICLDIMGCGLGDDGCASG